MDTATQTAETPQIPPEVPLLTKDEKVKFSFKKADALGTKRAPVELTIPVPTFDGLVSFLSNPDQAINAKNQKFILDLIFEVIKEQARAQVTDENKPVNSQKELDTSQLDLTYIANLPPSERKATKIDPEIWEEFGKVYMAVMPGATGKTVDQVGNQLLLFTKKLVPCKTRKDILEKLKPQLATFYGTINEEQKENFQEIYEFLDGKIDTYMSGDEIAKAMENL